MFKSDLVVTHLIGTGSYRLKEPLIYDGKIKIVVPAGFIYDGASVPKLFTNVFPKSGARYDRAACLHDFLYATRMFNRKKCDEIFLEAMKFDKMTKWKAWIIYKSVRLFGGKAYSAHKALDPNKIKL